MAGRGTFSDLRARLGVPKKAEPIEIQIEPELPSEPSLPSPAKPSTAFQGKRKRRPPRVGESADAGMVYATCLGAAFDLQRLMADWRVGSPSALGLSKLMHRLEFLSERADYPVLHGSLIGGEELFVMEFGCAVCWGCSRPVLTLVIDSLWPFLTSSREKKVDVHVDDLFYTVPSARDSEISSFISKDNILLATDDINERLAHAYAFAQSAKLDVFERGVSRAIEGMDDYPALMAKTGSLSMTDRRHVSKKIGELFVHGCDVNLRSDVLEVPDILWDLEAIVSNVYHGSRKYLDIQARSEILNHRLGVMQEMYEMIQEELQFAESNRIEWIIIVLICVNVLIELGMMAIEWATT